MNNLREIKTDPFKNAYFSKEPVIHSHISNKLTDNHSLRNVSVYCYKCGEMLHASNNECMQTWIETEFGNFCTNCFKLTEVMENLRDNEKLWIKQQ